MKLEIPKQVLQLIYALEEAQCRAYVVGPCVRDLIRGLEPMEYDIITNADFEEMHYVFRDKRIISSNRQKGEMLISVLGFVVQASTYRSENTEEKVTFSDNLLFDLATRDFSINAIAYHPRKGMKDPFKGLSCITDDKIIIKAIGEYPVSLDEFGEESNLTIKLEPESCFKREPINIFKAFIAAATDWENIEFIIDEITKKAILENKELIKTIKPEFLSRYFSNLLLCKKAPVILDEYREIFAEFLPEIVSTFDFNTLEPDQSMTLWEHIYKSVGFSAPQLPVRYTMLFHNLGKPDCFSLDAEGKGQYFGHGERSRLLGNAVMGRLELGRELFMTIDFLVENHDVEIKTDRKSLKVLLCKFDIDDLKKLIQCKIADTMAKNNDLEKQVWEYRKAIETLDNIISTKECWNVNQLAINSRDLMARGLVNNKKKADAVLNALLELVIEEPEANKAVVLMDFAQKLLKKK